MHASIQLYEPNSSRRIGPQTGRVPAEAFDVVSVHSRSLTVGWGMRSTSSVHVLESGTVCRRRTGASISLCKRDIYEVAKYTESTGVDILAPESYACQVSGDASVGAGAQLQRHQKFHRPRTGPVVVQFTTEACALCPDGDAQDRGLSAQLLLGGYSHDQLSQKRL